MLKVNHRGPNNRQELRRFKPLTGDCDQSGNGSSLECESRTRGNRGDCGGSWQVENVKSAHQLYEGVRVQDDQGIIGPMGNQRESSMYQAERRKNQATADRKAFLIKDAVGVGITSPNSHRKPHHIRVKNCKMIFNYILLCTNKCHSLCVHFIISNFSL